MTRAPALYRGNDRLLYGMILGVVAFWLPSCCRRSKARTACLGTATRRWCTIRSASSTMTFFRWAYWVTLTEQYLSD